MIKGSVIPRYLSQKIVFNGKGMSGKYWDKKLSSVWDQQNDATYIMHKFRCDKWPIDEKGKLFFGCVIKSYKCIIIQMLPKLFFLGVWPKQEKTWPKRGQKKASFIIPELAKLFCKVGKIWENLLSFRDDTQHVFKADYFWYLQDLFSGTFSWK